MTTDPSLPTIVLPMDNDYQVPPHPPGPIVPDEGGPVLAHPQLVVITYADDPYRPDLEGHAKWIATSSWLTTVGAEYGVGTGSILGLVELTDSAPDLISDTEITALLGAGIQNGTMPKPADGSSTGALYMIYFPWHTRIVSAAGTSCVDYGGYHSETVQSGFHFAYAVLPSCPGSEGLSFEELAASHELIEAATDPFPGTAPTYALYPESNGWAFVGGEVGDLCEFETDWYRSGPYTAQRIYSNAAARAGDQPPCIPVDTQVPYFNVATSTTVFHVQRGAILNVPLVGWSTDSVPDWTLSASVKIMNAPPPTMFPPPPPPVSAFVDRPTINSGGNATLIINVSATQVLSLPAEVFVTSTLPPFGSHAWLVAVVEP
jgi:hypothetical protein